MPAIIYQKTAGALVAQPDRTVATFESGLVRVDQTFICPTTDAEGHRLTLAVGNEFPDDSSPAIDGLYIYPAPQEIRRGDGFTEFKISGFGRTTDQFLSYRTRINNVDLQTISLSGDPAAPQQTLVSTGIIAQVIEVFGKITIPIRQNVTYADLNLPLEYSDPINFFLQTTTTGTTPLTLTVAPGVPPLQIITTAGWNGEVMQGEKVNINLLVELPGSITFANYQGSYTRPFSFVVNSQEFYGQFIELDIVAGVAMSNRLFGPPI